MHFLLTNDDGIDAAGLGALAMAASHVGRATWVAPTRNWSVCSHRVTTDQAIRAERRHENRWAVDGTPADCVRLALTHLAVDFDWVLAGMNHGGNLGADTHHSGTVAAVREAALRGRPGIAFSHYRKRGLDIDWSRAGDWIRRVLDDLLPRPIEPGAFWNVNFPHLRGDEPEPRVVHCPVDPSPLPLAFRAQGDSFHYEADYHARPRRPGHDIEACFQGDISVSKMEAGANWTNRVWET